MEASSEQAYLFRHAVLQEVAYQLQPPTERSRLHGWIVRIMENLFPEQIEEHALALANHAFHAHQEQVSKPETRSLRGKEVHYLRLAAEVAVRRYDNVHAITLLKRLANLPWTPPADVFNSLETVARLLLDAGSYGQAAEVVQQLLHVARSNSAPADEAKALLLLARVAGNQGRVADAMVYAQQAEYQAGRSADRSLQMRLYNDLGAVSFRRGEAQKAIAQFEQGVKLARELGMDPELVSVLNRAGATHVMEGNLDQGEVLLDEAAELAVKHGDLRNLAAVRANQGVLYRRRGRYMDALERYQESQEISLRIGMRDNLVNCIDNRGVVLNMLGRFEEAQQAHTEASRLARELGDRRREASSTLNGSLIQRRLGNRQRAMEMMNTALDLQRKEGDLRGQINSLVNRGNMQLYDLEMTFEALHDYIRAETLSEQIGSKYEVLSMRLRQADALHRMSRYKDAISICRAAIVEAAGLPQADELLRTAHFRMCFPLKEDGQLAEARKAATFFVEQKEALEQASLHEDLEKARALLRELDGC